MNKVLNYFLAGVVFIFPLFFLPLTQEYFLTNKFYLLGFGAVLIVLISTIGLLLSKKIAWKKGPLDAAVVLFFLTTAVSVVVSSPNKVGAILNIHAGLVTLLSLTIVFFAISQINHRVKLGDYLNALTFSGVVLALVSIVTFFQPFKNVVLPQNLQFLSSANFSPVGGIIDSTIFLGFVAVLVGAASLSRKSRLNPLQVGSLVVIVLALILNFYSIFRQLSQGLSFVLPPYRLSWYAAVEALKQPLTALFGVGVDNFSSIFTRVKDLAYNQSNLWQINSFNVSRSAVLHIMTTLGLFGVVAFGLLLFNTFRAIQQSVESKTTLLAGLGYLGLVLLLFPPSLILFFALFVLLALINKQVIDERKIEPTHLYLAGLAPVYFLILLVALSFVAGSGYLLGRTYGSEYYFKKAADGFAQRNGAEYYNNLRKAVSLNKYNEGFHLEFARANLILANNQAQRAREAAQEEGTELKLSEQQRQSITQFIQAAIQESKSPIILNSQKANYWESLASTYRGIINIAQGADVWTLSSYQRAIALDPQNPVYYINLGGVYYAAGNFNNASQLFARATALKPDWPNAHYNLAWSLYRQEKYQEAAQQMQAVLKLLEKNKGSADYKKAEKELAEFKQKVAATETKTGEEGQLELPQTPQPQLSPKLELPKNAEPPKTASPEAR